MTPIAIAHCIDPSMRSWVDLTLMTLTFVLSIIWNVEVGIVVSIIISLLLVVRRSSKTRMSILVRSDSLYYCLVQAMTLRRGGYLGLIDGNPSMRIKRLRKKYLAY